jgi:hypothetical protein
MEREIRVWLLSGDGRQPAGVGRTLNVSSGGILFTAPTPIAPGRRLEVSISWPAQLNANCGLRLVARGSVVRFEDGKIALRIREYEFRTESANAAADGTKARYLTRPAQK